eukprot:COSAG02_NODE_58282_length_278_cov_0.519553_1_plen_35_part_10
MIGSNKDAKGCLSSSKVKRSAKQRQRHLLQLADQP